MERDEVLAVLVAKGVELLDVPALQESDLLLGSGVDSLALVEWVLDVEDALGVELTEADVAASPTVGALADLIVSKLA